MLTSQQLAKQLPRIIAHRGASAWAPENTLAAFRKAAAIGARWVEFDVMLSACGEAIVIHDDTLERTTNGQGYVANYSYAQLQRLDSGAWFSDAYQGEKIPALTDVLLLLQQESLAANLEIKPSINIEYATVKKIMEQVKTLWTMQQLPLLISSFSRTILKQVRSISRESLLAFLMHEWQADWQACCDELNCVSVHVNHVILTPDKVTEIKNAKRLVLAYTVDNVLRAQELFSWGVDAVFSNCPEEICKNLL